MSIRVLIAALVAAAASGCTSYSSPMTNTNVTLLNDGRTAWHVQCQGLLASNNTCMQRAQEICKDKQVRLVGSVDHMGKDLNAVKDARDITFMCGAAPTAEPGPAPAAIPAPAPAPEAKPLRTITLQGDTNFATNKSELTPAAQRKLDEFIQQSEGYRIQRVIIAGHTDSTGSLALNERLSEARARSAQVYLQTHGLRADNYDVQGFGPSSPVASNATAAGRAQNRRVDIRTEGIEIRAVTK